MHNMDGIGHNNNDIILVQKTVFSSLNNITSYLNSKRNITDIILSFKIYNYNSKSWIFRVGNPQQWTRPNGNIIEGRFGY